MNEVSIGSIVEFKRTMKGYSEIKKFKISDYGNTSIPDKKISYDSPLGKSLLGKRRGDNFSLQLPNTEINIEIIQLHKTF